MPGLQVLSAPTNQPTLNPVVQRAPVQPALAPRVLPQPQNAPVLAPKVVTAPQQPTLAPQVLNQPQGQQETLPVSYGHVIDSIIAAKGRGADPTTILQAIIDQNPDSQPLFQTAIERGATPEQILDKIIQDNYTPSNPQPDAPANNGDNSLLHTAGELAKFGLHSIPGIGNLVHSDVNTGIAKGIGSTLSGIETLGQKALDKIAEPFVGKPTAPTANDVFGPKLKAKNTAEKIGKGIEQVGEFFVPGGAVADAGKALESTLTAGKGSRAIAAGLKGLLGAGEAGGITAAQTGGDKKATISAAVLGGLFPSISSVVEAAANKFSPRLVNSLIKPVSKDFEFGKNPGKAVVNEGIKATTWEGLIDNIKSVKNTIGEQIGQILSHPEVAKQKINIGKSLEPIDTAIQKATSQGDQALVTKLLEFRDGLTKEYGLVEGRLVETGSKPSSVNPNDALKIKGDIGDSVRWREGIDSEVNKVKVQVYKSIRSQIEDAVNIARKSDSTIKDISPLNTRYANLTTAESAAQYRKNVINRLNLTSLAQKGTLVYGLGSAAKDAITGHKEDIVRDLAIGGLGFAGEKALGGVGGKTYSAQLLNEIDQILPLLQKLGLGVNSQTAK